IIYPISDSKWVSPTQIVPKKSGVTVFENDKGEMVPTRVTARRRMCIDYRKLNSVTRKDHSPLPFLDQILERVAGHIMFLSGFYGRFIENFSAIARPLNNLLEKDAKFDWNYACQEAFEKLIKMLTSTPVMQPPNWSIPFEIMCEARGSSRPRKRQEACCYLLRKQNFELCTEKLHYNSKRIACCLIPLHWTLSKLSKVGQNYSTLHLFPGKLRTKWTGPFIVKRVFQYGTVEVEDPNNRNIFKVNGQRLKPYLGICVPEDETISLNELVYQD
ncbi:hypothetical protein Prudu_293S000300, partial [Prunus dulcis]